MWSVIIFITRGVCESRKLFTLRTIEAGNIIKINVNRLNFLQNYDLKNILKGIVVNINKLFKNDKGF